MFLLPTRSSSGQGWACSSHLELGAEPLGKVGGVAMPLWDSLCDYQCPLTAHTPPPAISPLRVLSRRTLTVSLKFPTWLFPLIFSLWHLLRMLPPASPDDVSFLMVSPHYPLMESPDPVPLTVYPMVSSWRLLMMFPSWLPSWCPLMTSPDDVSLMVSPCGILS